MERLQRAITKSRIHRDKGGVIHPDRRVRASEEAWATLAPFAPDPRHLARMRLATRPGSSDQSEVDMLRTRLLRLMSEKQWRRVLITSPRAGCGATTVTANLALALQRQIDLRCLVMDLDLQRAELGRVLGLRPTHGVADLLCGRVDHATQIRRAGGNLAVSASRAPVSDPGYVLQSEQAAHQIDTVQRALEPDIILFDCAPHFLGDEVIAASRFADCAVIVGAAGETSVAELDRVESDLAQYIAVAGIVLTKCRF
ncbi:CpsD/CapB family tyrosine-protein kinase [Roseivivax sediminis]|nr:CpsD/CapB family tyrosine-protein kinase [Roseivivax sediminis]